MPEQNTTTSGDRTVLSDQQVDVEWAALLEGMQAPARRATAVWEELRKEWAGAADRTASSDGRSASP